MGIKVGYEVGTGTEVSIENSHLIVTGLTQLSGKTTTLEALIRRSKKRAIVFTTKPGERSFSETMDLHVCPPFLKQKSDWQYVSSLFEARMKEKMRFERAWIIKVCKGTHNLQEVQTNVQKELSNGKIRGLDQNVYTTLNEYLNLIIPEISKLDILSDLRVEDGLNVMHLEKISTEVQSLIIQSTLETVLHQYSNTIIVIPEAWKFLPQESGNPCKRTAEEFIRQGAARGNYLWVDSQDVTGVDKTPLKQVSTWILGLQTEMNEVKRTLDQMPIPKSQRPKPEEIMTLERGHFFVCTPKFHKKTYVQPAWLWDDEVAKKVSMGELTPESVHIAEGPTKARKGFYPIPEEKIYSGSDNMQWYKLLVDDIASEIERRHSNEPAVIPLSVSKEWSEKFESLRQEWHSFPGKVEHRELPTMDKISSIVDAVVTRITPMITASGGIAVQVAPIEALKQQFLVEAKDRIVGIIKGLPESERKALKFVEAAGRGISHKDVCEKCFSRPSTGGSSVDVKNIVMRVVDTGMLRRDKNAITYPCLKEKIQEELGFHDAKPDEIEQLYAHVINELL